METSDDLGKQLYVASCGGHVHEVVRLLARGAPVNWRNSVVFERTALHAACLCNHPAVVKILAEQDGIDVNVQSTTLGSTPLHWACWGGHLKCVQLLMATGQCALGAMTSEGLTPLGEAVRRGRLDTVKYLVSEFNVDVCAGQVKPLSLSRNNDITQLLLKHGAKDRYSHHHKALGSQFIISIQPKDVSCKPGEEAKFTVSTSPTASTCTYQWYFQNQSITIGNLDCNGQTSNCLQILKFLPRNKGIYWCAAENASGTRVTSHLAALTADGEIIKRLELQYIGRILKKSAINFSKFGIQTEHLLTGESDVTYEEMEFIMNVNPCTQVLSINLKQEITSRLKEEQLYAEAILKKPRVSLSYTKILALGPGQVGKSTFVRRLLGIMKGNIQTSSSETQPQSSTGISELREACIQYTRVTGAITINRKWCVLQDDLHCLLRGLMSLIVKQSQEDLELTQIIKPAIKKKKHVLPVTSSAQMEMLTDDAVPLTEKENNDQTLFPLNEDIGIQYVKPLPVGQNSTRRTKQQGHALVPPESDIDRTIRNFEELREECRIYLERIDFDMLFHIADIGGQPAFLEMLPSLTIGPALYLVFMKLKQGLSSRYNVQFKCNNSKMKLFKNYSYTSEEVMFTALSSIACFGHSDEQVEMYIRKPSLQNEKQNLRKDALALLVGTFLDEIQNDEQLNLEDVTNQLEKRLNDTVFYKQGLIHLKSFSLLVNNMSAEDSEIEEQRDFLEKIIRDKFREYQIPTQWLMLSICLKLLAKNQSKYYVSFDDCVLLGKRLGMDRDMVSVALQFLHKYIGLVMYFPHHENLKKIVICNPQLVFSTISELIFNIYDHNKNQVSEAQYDHFVQTGCFSPQDITLITSKDVSMNEEKKKLLSIDMLVDLLVYLNIAAKVPLSSAKDEYFLPAVLQTAEIDIVKRVHNSINEELLPEPICIGFKTGFLPLGFVCALSANLIAENKFHLLTGESNKFYKNRIQFRFQGKFNITMISWPKYAEFRVTRHSGSDEFWSKDCCPLINEIVCTAANKVIQSMQHGLRSATKDSKMYELAFHCPRHPNADFGQESLAELLFYDNLDKRIPEKAICTNPECVTAVDPLTPEMMVWFGKVPNTPLRIEKQPSRTQNAINIIAKGVRPLTYEWFLEEIKLCDDQDHDGCTTDKIILEKHISLSEGVYKCKVKDKFGNSVESVSLDLFEEELRRRKLQKGEIRKLKDNGFKSIRELQGIHLEKLDFFNLAEKERIKLLLISVREDNAKEFSHVRREERSSIKEDVTRSSSGAPVTLQAIMKRHSLTDEQLNCEIGDSDIPYLAMHFDGVSPYCHVMELSAAEQADLNELYHKNGTQVAMTDCLILWKRREPSTSTYGALLCILLRLGKGDIAHKVGNFMAGEIATVSSPDVSPEYTDSENFSSDDLDYYSAVEDLNELEEDSSPTATTVPEPSHKLRSQEKEPQNVPEWSLHTLTVELKTLTDPIRFGIQLNVPEEELAIIRKDHHLDTKCQKTALFQYLANNHKSRAITWSSIADALYNINYVDLSLDIREKYCANTRCSKQQGFTIGQAMKRPNSMELAGVAATEISDNLLPASRPTENCPSTGELVMTGLTLAVLKKRNRVSDTQLDTEVIEHDIYILAGCFDNLENYLDQLRLTPGQQTYIYDIAVRQDIQTAMAKALKLWRAPNPLVATFRALLTIILDLKRGDVAVRVCQYIADRVPQ